MLMLDRARELVERRSILRLLVVRDLKVRYSSSALGYVWTILDPLMMALVYWFVFGFIFQGHRKGLDPYILFLVVGVLTWQWFNGGVMDTTRALQQESKLVRSTNLPREIWVLKIVFAKGVEFLLSIPVIVLFMIRYGVPPRWDILWALPAAMLLQTVLITGVGLALAAVTVLVTDMQRVVRILLRVAFYVTPIVYSVDALNQHPALKYVMALNPMTGIVDLYRRCVDLRTPSGASAFDGTAGWHVPAISAVVTVALFVLGSSLFRRLEPAVLKEL
ncbi:ABC transporter permease [Kineosporia sp. A_224]|uniref:ABC transporter permease n=1 Tax=Kineosporia sp. A_224 TaxID=1962180 RepID=UPI000B4A6762|nr:ABC transporter permease [Kineosporia sp. A_224]